MLIAPEDKGEGARVRCALSTMTSPKVDVRGRRTPNFIEPFTVGGIKLFHSCSDPISNSRFYVALIYPR